MSKRWKVTVGKEKCYLWKDGKRVAVNVGASVRQSAVHPETVLSAFELAARILNAETAAERAAIAVNAKPPQ